MDNGATNSNENLAHTLRMLIKTVRSLQHRVDTAHEKKLEFDEKEKRQLIEKSDPFMKLLHIEEEEELLSEIDKLPKTAPDTSVLQNNCTAVEALREIATRVTDKNVYTSRVAEAFKFVEQQLYARENLSSALQEQKDKTSHKTDIDIDSPDVDIQAIGKESTAPLKKGDHELKHHSVQYKRIRDSIAATRRMQKKRIHSGASLGYDLHSEQLLESFHAYIVLLGAGPVGKILSNIFVRLGVQDLLLVDNKYLKPVDILNHQYNATFANQNRATALMKQLQALNYYNLEHHDGAKDHVSIRPCEVDLNSSKGFHDFQKYLMMLEEEKHYKLLIENEDKYVRDFGREKYEKKCNEFSAYISKIRKKRRPPNIIVSTVHSVQIKEKVYNLVDKLEIPLITIHLNKDGRGGVVRFRKPKTIGRKKKESHINDDGTTDSTSIAKSDINKLEEGHRKKWPSTIRILSGIAADMAMRYIWRNVDDPEDTNGKSGNYTIRYDDRQGIVL